MQRLTHTFAFMPGEQVQQNYSVCQAAHTFIQSQGPTDIWHTQFKGTIWIVYLAVEYEVFVL